MSDKTDDNQPLEENANREVAALKVPMVLSEIAQEYYKEANEDDEPFPVQETSLAAGMDLRSLDSVRLDPGESQLIHTGLFVALPEGYEGQIRPRSGLAMKHGVTVLNSPGTVDADYRGEVGVLLINHGQEQYLVRKGDRIAQMVVASHERVQPVLVDTMDETDRGEGGFGSTGAA